MSGYICAKQRTIFISLMGQPFGGDIKVTEPDVLQLHDAAEKEGCMG